MSVCVNNVCKTSVTAIATKLCNFCSKPASDTFGYNTIRCNRFSKKKSSNNHGSTKNVELQGMQVWGKF